MPYTDKQLTCVDCGQSFTFSAEQQEKWSSGSPTSPSAPCRAEKKKQHGGGGNRPSGGAGRGGGGSREMFTAECAECGKEARVPFKPRGDRPVYCSDCFSKRR